MKRKNSYHAAVFVQGCLIWVKKELGVYKDYGGVQFIKRAHTSEVVRERTVHSRLPDATTLRLYLGDGV